MSLELFMVGVITEDMAKSVEFYRRLGVNVPEGSENQQHVTLKMGSISFFLSTKQMNARWDPSRTDVSGTGYRIILEFYLETRAAVEGKYAEMIAYGYQSHTAPYMTSFNMCFAMIDDPDGNTILISGEPEPVQGSQSS